MEPPSTPPDRKRQRLAPETPPKDKRFSEIVVFHNSHNLVFFSGKGSAAQELNLNWQKLKEQGLATGTDLLVRRGWQAELARGMVIELHRLSDVEGIRALTDPWHRRSALWRTELFTDRCLWKNNFTEEGFCFAEETLEIFLGD